MSMDSHLIHRCTIQRPEKQDPDAYNNEPVVYHDWEIDVPCRLVIREQRQYSSELAQAIVVTTYQLFLSSSSDVAEGDRIADLVYEDGTEVGEAFTVRGIYRRRTRVVRHITLKLERIS
jgi:hypothetical protein